MSQQQEPAKPGSVFNTAVFAVIVFAGAFAGRAVCGFMLPETESAMLIATAMVPLGVTIGVSIGLGSPPPESILNLFSVFGGRHTVDEIIARGGTNGGAPSLAVATALGTAGTCAALAAVINIFLKPDIGMGELMIAFGGFGLVYGGFVAAVVWFGLGGE